MIVAHDVKRSVDDEAQQLLASGYPLAPGVLAGDFDADVDVTNHDATLSGAPETERYHVGWTVVP